MDLANHTQEQSILWNDPKLVDLIECIQCVRCGADFPSGSFKDGTLDAESETCPKCPVGD